MSEEAQLVKGCLLRFAIMVCFSLMSLGRAAEPISLGSHVVPGQGGFSQRMVVANFMTNGVPFLWHVIYSNRPMRREHSNDVLILYHVVSERTNSVGRVVAIEFRNMNSNNLETCQLPLRIPCATEFGKRKDRWNGPQWQFLKREIAPKGLMVLDYYEGEKMLSTIITTTNDVIRDIVFTQMRTATSHVPVTDFSKIAFFNCCPLVSIGEVEHDFLEWFSSGLKKVSPDMPESKARLRAVQRIETLKCLEKFWHQEFYIFKTMSQETFVERMSFTTPGVRKRGFCLSKDSNTIFVTCSDNWATYSQLPTLDLDGFVVLADRIHCDCILLPDGRRVSKKFNDAKNLNVGHEVIAETVDGRRRLVRLYPGCLAYYENDALKALLCEKFESQMEYDALIKILKASGELPIICSSYEY